MTEHSNIDPAERKELEERASVEPEQGAIRGDVASGEQANAWESAKIGLASEQGVRREMARAGEPPATAADEAFHGRVSAQPPRRTRGCARARCRRRPRGSTPWAWR
jgi:hypothetical protein